jgi:hypothetical protein
MAAADQKVSGVSYVLAHYGWWLIAAAAVIAVGVSVCIWWRRPRIEDPSRLTEFLSKVQELEWTAQTAGVSLQTLEKSLASLVQAEIQYYYVSRTRRRMLSQFFRWLAFLLGTLGILCPLIEAAYPSLMLAKPGYIALALAAACFAGNELFGGTSGHIRSVSTQYRLEGLLTKFVIEQSAWRYERANPTNPGDAGVADPPDHPQRRRTSQSRGPEADQERCA